MPMVSKILPNCKSNQRKVKFETQLIPLRPAKAKKMLIVWGPGSGVEIGTHTLPGVWLCIDF